jgi:hypothetical protein
MQMKVGDWLPNGAVVLAEKAGVVLAFNNCGTKDEYVTWRWDGKDPATTIWGHYHKLLSNAALDFEARVHTEEVRGAR